MVQVEFSWVTGPVLRAARILSGLSVRQVAAIAGLGEATIKRAEASQEQTRLTRANLKALLAAYAQCGLTIEGNDADKSFSIGVKRRP